MNGGFRIITGKATDEMTRSMFVRARSSIQGIWSLKRTKRFGLIQPFIHSVKDGVKAEVICQMTSKNVREVKEILRVAEVRHCDGAEYALRFTVVDGKEVNMQATPVDSGLEEGLSIWSDNQALIQTMVSTFKILWRNSMRSESRLLELSSEIRV